MLNTWHVGWRLWRQRSDERRLIPGAVVVHLRSMGFPAHPPTRKIFDREDGGGKDLGEIVIIFVFFGNQNFWFPEGGKGKMEEEKRWERKRCKVAKKG